MCIHTRTYTHHIYTHVHTHYGTHMCMHTHARTYTHTLTLDWGFTIAWIFTFMDEKGCCWHEHMPNRRLGGHGSFPYKRSTRQSCLWPVTLTPAASALWSRRPASDLWLCLRIHIGVSVAWGHQTHFTCALHQIWSQRCQEGGLTQLILITFPLPMKSVYLKYPIQKTCNPGPYTKHSRVPWKMDLAHLWLFRMLLCCDPASHIMSPFYLFPIAS